ncbi:MAG: DUF2092 domain-containing protein [Anaerolineae bacterium]|nr:DUF2092 domain-containing protein [Anaerolineae bacterium]
MKGNVWLAFSLLLVLSLALAGRGQKITAEEIVARMRETVENTKDAHAVVTVALDAQGKQISATVELWEQSPNKIRTEALEASEPDLVGMLLVSDGQQGWTYDPQRHRVVVGPMGDLELPPPQEMLIELQDTIQAMLDASDIELAGEETVAGRPAYKLWMSPKEDSKEGSFPGDGKATLWVDQERWIVLKATYESGAFGQRSMEVQSFELNPGLSNDLFTFQAPEGAEVVDIEAEQPSFMTLDEAQAQAGFPLLVPEYVPGDATLIQVFQVQGAIVLGYDHSPEVSFTIMQGPEPIRSTPPGEAQEITVRGQSATLITDESVGFAYLHWIENDVSVTIGGRLIVDEALKVAESLK